MQRLQKDYSIDEIIDIQANDHKVFLANQKHQRIVNDKEQTFLSDVNKMKKTVGLNSQI